MSFTVSRIRSKADRLGNRMKSLMDSGTSEQTLNPEEPLPSDPEDSDLENRDAELRMYFREGLPVQRVHPTKALDSIEDKITAAAGDASKRRLPDGAMAPVRQATQSIVAQPGVQQLIVNGIDKFSVAMPALVKGLEEVAKIHPIVQGVFLVFKVVYIIEKTRRENDQKVLALFVQMRELMEMLCRLKDIKKHPDTEKELPEGWSPAADGETTTIKSCIFNIRRDLRDCYNACDTFSKKRRVTRLLQCADWNAQFASYAETFQTRKGELSTALRFYMAGKITSVAEDIDAMRQDLRAMKDMFLSNVLLTTRDQHLLRYIKERGGAEKVLQDDAEVDKLSEKAADISVTLSRRPDQRDLLQAERERVRAEAYITPGDAITKNFQEFEFRLDRRLGQLRADIQQLGDRLVKEINKGAHEKVQDQFVRKLWRDSSWGSAVEARYFIVALKELYDDRVRAGDNSVTDDEIWAIEYIDLQYARPISEALDEDASGFVTVAEMNRFTAALTTTPKWSLPVWIAYWAAGWKQLQIVYAHEIEATAAKIHALSWHVQPENWDAMRYYLWSAQFACYALTGGLALETVAEDDIAPMFTRYAAVEEARVKAILEKLRYRVDSRDSLTLALGSGCIEKSGLLLLRLLLLRHYDVVQAAQHRVLDRAEFYDAASSLENVDAAFRGRALHISHGWSHQNIDLSLRFRSFASGLLNFAHSPQEFEAASYTRSYFRSELAYSRIDESERSPRSPNEYATFLNYPSYAVGVPDVDLWAYDRDAIEKECRSEPKSTQQYPFLGRWTGRHLVTNTVAPPSLESVHIWLDGTPSPTGAGALRGLGWSSRGRATITGHFQSPDDDQHESRTRLQFQFDFSRDLGGFEDLRAFLLPRSLPTNVCRVFFRGEYYHAEGAEQLSGVWAAGPDESFLSGSSVGLGRESPKAPSLRSSVASRSESLVLGASTYWRNSEVGGMRSEQSETIRGRWRAIIHRVVLEHRDRPPTLTSTLMWLQIKARRDNRTVILTLLCRLFYASLTVVETEKLSECLAKLSADDGWCYFSRLKWASRSLALRHGISCNLCGRSVHGERLYCVDCQLPDDEPADSFDLCGSEACITHSDGLLLRGAAMHHESSHRLVLFRRRISRFYYQQAIGSVRGWAERDYVIPAMKALEAQLAGKEATDADDIQCSVCRGPLNFPFWVCLANDCYVSDAYTCDACVHSAPCTNPRRDVQYACRQRDGDFLYTQVERTFDTVHPVDHHLLRCARDMKREGEKSRPDTRVADVAKKHQDEEHAQLVREHKELMQSHKELMDKHAQILAVMERLSPAVFAQETAPLNEAASPQ